MLSEVGVVEESVLVGGIEEVDGGGIDDLYEGCGDVVLEFYVVFFEEEFVVDCL